MNTIRRFPFTPVALAVALLIAACGDDNDQAVGTTTSTTSAPTSTSSTTGTGEPAECSAAGLPADPADDPGLPAPVAEMRREIVEAAVECDYERLAELARRGTFTYSFGADDDPAAFWREAEEEGEDPLAALVQFLNRPFATRPAGDVTQYVWPRAYAYESWDAVPEEAREGLRPVYGEEDFERFARFGSYIGYRVGITADGDWVFFVAGD